MIFIVVWESSENQVGQPPKKVDKLFKFFLKIRPTPPPPLREIPKSAPGSDKSSGSEKKFSVFKQTQGKMLRSKFAYSKFHTVFNFKTCEGM